MKKYKTIVLVCTRGHILDTRHPFNKDYKEGDKCPDEMSHDIMAGGTSYCRRVLKDLPLVLKGQAILDFIKLIEDGGNTAWSGQLWSWYSQTYHKTSSTYRIAPIFKNGYIEKYKKDKLLFKITDLHGRKVWVNTTNVKLTLNKKWIIRDE